MTITDTPNILDAVTPTDTLDAADVLIAEGRQLLAQVADYARRARPVLADLNATLDEHFTDVFGPDGELVDDGFTRAWPGSTGQRLAEIGMELTRLSTTCGGDTGDIVTPDEADEIIAAAVARTDAQLEHLEDVDRRTGGTWTDAVWHTPPVDAIKMVSDQLEILVPVIESYVVHGMEPIVPWWDDVLATAGRADSMDDETTVIDRANESSGHDALADLWRRVKMLAEVATDDLGTHSTGGVVPWFDAFQEARNEEARRQVAERRALDAADAS